MTGAPHAAPPELALTPQPDSEREPGPVAALIAEYTEYVRRRHAICRSCPVVRSGVPIVASMLRWKAAQPDARPMHWTRRDLREYLLGHLPQTTADRELLVDAPTCAKDLVYFLGDRGSLAGDEPGVLVDATEEILDMHARPGVFTTGPARSEQAQRRRARRKLARSARRRNRAN
ncbi:MAG: hypothetical protein ACRDLV_16055 [Solirubrobacteraceae bacterium]